MFSLGIFVLSQILAFLAGLVYYPGRLKSRVDDLSYSVIRMGVLVRQDREHSAKSWAELAEWNDGQNLIVPVFFQSSAELLKACQLSLLDVVYSDYYSYSQFKDTFDPLLFESELKQIRPIMERSVLVVRSEDLSLGLNKVKERRLAYLNGAYYSSEFKVKKYLTTKLGDLQEAFLGLDEYNNPLSLIRALDAKEVDMISMGRTDFYRSLERLGVGRAKYRFLWLSKPYPGYLFSVNKENGTDVNQRLLDFFNGRFIGEGTAEMRLVPVEETFFDPKNLDLDKLKLVRDSL